MNSYGDRDLDGKLARKRANISATNRPDGPPSRRLEQLYNPLEGRSNEYMPSGFGEQRHGHHQIIRTHNPEWYSGGEIPGIGCAIKAIGIIFASAAIIAVIEKIAVLVGGL